MNNYKYDDLTTMYLDKENWIHQAHKGRRATMTIVKLLQPIAKRTRSQLAILQRHVELMKSIPSDYARFRRQHGPSAFNVLQMLQLVAPFLPLRSVFTLLRVIGRNWMLLSVSARAGNDGILIVVLSVS
jgi:hypothetical protein